MKEEKDKIGPIGEWGNDNHEYADEAAEACLDKLKSKKVEPAITPYTPPNVIFDKIIEWCLDSSNG